MSKNVKLGVRVRPFSERERKSEKDRVSVVNVVDENTVTITNIKVSVSGAGDSRERVRQYYADYTFDSACPATNPAYASQEKVFEAIGRDVLASVSRGVSACVLAYGQSATGKTHTMMGTELDPGLIPRLCAALAKLQSFDLTVSFLEIYNERVHDLLGEVAPTTCHSLPRRRGNARKDLRVREHPDKGPYVQNLRRVAVQDVATLLSLVKEGTSRRRTAATRRNSTSSRSHALLELTTSSATLHLADLAGSEKASWEGCGGGRQKEGANINKSLVALSNVISALVSGGSGRGRFVPYRDSALTWLLKDCFTGGANTFIVATVSPSVACYGESASTLRWAARARQLPTQRTINTTTNATSRAALQAQFTQLLAELSRNYILYVPETGKISYDDKHWTLHVINKDNTLDGSNKITKIGNIMDLLHPKTDAQSESTASSVASGSSDVINTMDKQTEIENEIRKEVDKLFVPSLERTNSSTDLKIIAPLRHKRRQYKSQEVLPIDETLITNRNHSSASALPSQSDQQIHTKTISYVDKLKSAPIPILYDSQRAEIVASVTERLYSKLKKKEEAAVSKVEAVVDKKIMEPLSELRICTNARQRLIELSHKAIRNKRRIGIPAHTQTRPNITRMRDQGIDVQADLEAYVYRNRRFYALQKDVATITESITPRCKEIAVGSRHGTLDLCDRSTITDPDIVVKKNSFAMTDIMLKYDKYTQTPIVPPPRKKKRISSVSRYLKNMESKKHCLEECNTVNPVININISHAYPTDKESQSSDDNVDLPAQQIQNEETSKVTNTPDLLTNHSAIDLDGKIVDEINQDKNTVNVFRGNEISDVIQNDKAQSALPLQNLSEEFSDSEYCSLPRVTVDTSKKLNHEDMKNMILGRNNAVYPYNIVLSPPRERESLKRIVTFKDLEIPPIMSVASQTSYDWESKSYSSIKSNVSSENILNSDREYNNNRRKIDIASDTTECSKMETDSFIWKKGSTANKSIGYSERNYTPVYKSNSRYKTAKARLYKEFLGLEKDYDDYENKHVKETSISENKEIENGSQLQFRQRKKFFEDTFKSNYLRNDFDKLELEILDSCDALEKTVNRYDNYLSSLPSNVNMCSRDTSTFTYGTPTEYLQHLVQLRREVVKADCVNESSLGISNK